MAVYAIYSYEIQEGGKSLFYKDTGTKAIDKANLPKGVTIEEMI